MQRHLQAIDTLLSRSAVADSKRIKKKSKESLCSLVRGFGKRTGIEARFDAVGDTSDINQAASLALLRVVQEALVNIHRHAHATYAEVLLQRRNNEIWLIVSDNGVGLPSGGRSHETPGGIGLVGMRRRVEALRGRIDMKNLKRGLQRIVAVAVKSRSAQAA